VNGDKMLLEYTELHENVFSPHRANPSDVGLDLFFSPDVPRGTHDEQKNMPAGSVVIMPNQNMKLRTGLSFAVPHGFCAEVKNRSSMSAKKELLVGGGVIDPGYSGEVVVLLHNVGRNPQIIHPGDKIAQLVIYPVIHVRAIQVDKDELYKDDIAISNRGTGGFGSTDQGKK
jgi:dUTP pyrophosphatase